MAVPPLAFQYSLADVEKLDKLRPHCQLSGWTGNEWRAFRTLFKDGYTMSLDVQAQQPELETNLLDTELGSTSGPFPEVALEDDSDVGAQKRVEPVSAGERFFAVDVLRGFALLGILAMNIVAFGWPEPAYDNPFRGGGFEGLDRGVWFFNHMVFEAKMMTIFSMLFGAGLVLMDQRALARDARVRGVYYRRILWLLAIGLLHSYLIWYGDILVLYAETGLFLYFFRNMRPRTLIILGFSAMLVLVPLVLGFAAAFDYMQSATARVEAQTKAGVHPTGLDQQLHDIWTKHVRDEIKPSPETKAKNWDKEMTAYRGGYQGVVKQRAFDVLMGQTFGFLLGGGFFAASRMLIGMGLMKLGVFSAQRSRRFYLWMLGLGYGVGLPLMVFDALELIRHSFSLEYHIHGGLFYNVFGSLIVALGHVGLLMLIVQSGTLRWLTTRLAAVGRMALSNYLTHSLACTTLFYGYGFGLFGHVNRTGLAAIVLTIWIIQLLISPIWLKYFRFGPAEWLWRSLTYWRLQPMRVLPTEIAASAS
jgi:uncharacterized protein